MKHISVFGGALIGGGLLALAVPLAAEFVPGFLHRNGILINDRSAELLLAVAVGGIALVVVGGAIAWRARSR